MTVIVGWVDLNCMQIIMLLHYVAVYMAPININ